MTFRIHLHRDSEAFIQRMLDTRRYAHASDAVFYALNLLEDQEKLRELKLAEFDAKIEEGLADLDGGRFIDADDVFDELEDMTEQAAVKRHAAE